MVTEKKCVNDEMHKWVEEKRQLEVCSGCHLRRKWNPTWVYDDSDVHVTEEIMEKTSKDSWPKEQEDEEEKTETKTEESSKELGTPNYPEIGPVSTSVPEPEDPRIGEDLGEPPIEALDMPEEK